MPRPHSWVVHYHLGIIMTVPASERFDEIEVDYPVTASQVKGEYGMGAPLGDLGFGQSR